MQGTPRLLPSPSQGDGVGMSRMCLPPPLELAPHRESGLWYWTPSPCIFSIHEGGQASEGREGQKLPSTSLKVFTSNLVPRSLVDDSR